MAKGNKITFQIIRKGAGEYVALIGVNGMYSGFSGHGSTPAKAKADAKRQLKKLGKARK